MSKTSPQRMKVSGVCAYLSARHYPLAGVLKSDKLSVRRTFAHGDCAFSRSLVGRLGRHLAPCSRTYVRKIIQQLRFNAIYGAVYKLSIITIRLFCTVTEI